MMGYRVLALDVGSHRIGIAMSDAEGILALPLTTINANPRSQAMKHIADLVTTHAVDEVVIGLPLTLRGEVGPQARLVQAFARSLKQTVAQPIRFVDERWTSVAAERSMRGLGIKPARRKAHVDEIAASIILQEYLDSIGRKR